MEGYGGDAIAGRGKFVNGSVAPLMEARAGGVGDHAAALVDATVVEVVGKRVGSFAETVCEYCCCDGKYAGVGGWAAGLRRAETGGKVANGTGGDG